MLDIYEVDKLWLVFVAGSPSWLTYTNTPLAPAKQKWSSEGRRGEAGAKSTMPPPACTLASPWIIASGLSSPSRRGTSPASVPGAPKSDVVFPVPVCP